VYLCIHNHRAVVKGYFRPRVKPGRNEYGLRPKGCGGLGSYGIAIGYGEGGLRPEKAVERWGMSEDEEI
jgi:hypothetical protein